jgi:hypothetical protein
MDRPTSAARSTTLTGLLGRSDAVGDCALEWCRRVKSALQIRLDRKTLSAAGAVRHGADGSNLAAAAAVRLRLSDLSGLACLGCRRSRHLGRGVRGSGWRLVVVDRRSDWIRGLRLGARCRAELRSRIPRCQQDRGPPNAIGVDWGGDCRTLGSRRYLTTKVGRSAAGLEPP